VFQESKLSKNNISIVIPAYNHERYIEEAIMSAVNQTVSGAEIVIVDDGSADRTRSVCMDLSRRFSQIRFVEQENQGAHIALNRGIALARGKFIAVLNSDDLFEVAKIEHCLSILDRNPNVEFIFGPVTFIDEKGRIQTSGVSTDWFRRALDFFYRSELLGLSLLNENFVVTTSNMVFSKKFWKSVMGFQPLRYCHDLEFLLEAARSVSCFVCPESIQVRYRVHHSNTIKEDVDQVRVEIASVIAQAIVEDKSKLIGTGEPRNLALFHEFLRNKNLSDLVLLLIMKYLEAENKTVFFEELMPNQKKKEYSVLFD